jgi:hypothetical protein
LWLFLLGPNAEFVGFGLSEISSAGLIYLAAAFAMRGRAGDAWLAGVLALLGVYTRLNNFPMAAAVMLFALPIGTPTHAAWRIATWQATRLRVAAIIGGMLGAGLLLFAARTWYYTGVFSVFHGTQRDHLAVWRPGMSAAAALESMFGSVMMVLTASDPPQFAWHAVPLLLAAGIALAAIAGLPLLRDAPLGVVGLFIAGCSSALVTRGWAYEGRFSVHLFGSAAALCAWGAASAFRRARGRFWYPPVSSLPTVKP